MINQVIRHDHVSPAIEAERSFAVELIYCVRRHKALIACIFIALSLLTLSLVQILPQTYRSAAFLAVDGRRIELVKVDDVLSSMPRDLEALGGEIEVLRSRELIEKAANQLGFFKDPEFNPALQGSDSPSQMRDVDPSQVTAVIDRILSRLDVEPQGRSRVIRVEFAASTAEKAAAFPNMLIECYLEAQIQDRAAANERADAWVSERLNQLRAIAEKSAQDAAAFRYMSGQARGKEGTLHEQAISELTTQIIAAGARRSEAAAKLQQAKQAQSSGEAIPVGEPASSVLQQLRLQAAESMRSLIQLEGRVDSDHPGIRQAKERLAATRKAIDDETARLVQSLKADYDAAVDAEKSLSEELERIKEKVGRTGASEARLAELEAVAAADRSVYQTFLTRSKEIKVQNASQVSDARVISKAPTPVKPAFPNKLLLLGAGIVTSLVIALICALVVDALDSGIRSMREAERALGYPALGILPNMRPSIRWLKPGSSLLPHLFRHAISDLLTHIIARHTEHTAPRIVAVTSTLPQEGKTTTSIALAQAGAEAGLRVLLVDADLRRSSIAKMLDLLPQPGLAECIRGEAFAQDVIQHDQDAGFSVMQAGHSDGNPAMLLASHRTRAILNDLSPIYDLIILDTTPIVVGADARVIAGVADRIIFLLRWGTTSRQVAARALQQLAGSSRSSIEIVLARVNLERNSNYSHGEGAHYSPRLRSYYSRA